MVPQRLRKLGKWKAFSRKPPHACPRSGEPCGLSKWHDRVRLTRLYVDQRGLTMAEVLCALVVISIGLLALAPAIQGSATLINRANVKTKAVFLSQQRLEQVKNRIWLVGPPTQDTLGVSADATTAPPTFPDEAYGSIAGYPNDRRTVRITDCGVAPGCGNPAIQSVTLRQVTVTVFYRPFVPEGATGAPAEESTQVTTLIARR